MKNLRITVNGTSYDVQVEELSAGAAPAPAAPAKAAAPASGEPVKSPMPGVILDIKVSEGQTVKKGDCVVILEAMKMENEIFAPTDGKIAAISVSKGQNVDSGTVLMTIN